MVDLQAVRTLRPLVPVRCSTSISENATLSKHGNEIQLSGRIGNVLPPFGVGLALIVNAAWVTFLAYCILSLI